MKKLVSSLVLAWLCAGCFSQARHVVVEAPDPEIGDLKCARPRITLLEALHYEREVGPVPEHCEAEL